MNIFDILGPIMVGPSSSHTAGAVRIGRIARKILDDEPVKADIYLSGSFLATGKGHGTDKAIVAGLLGMRVDDINIPDSFELAEKQGFKFNIIGKNIKNAHPNTALIEIVGKKGKQLKIQASSIGGGRISVDKIDDIEVNFSGDYNTIIIHNSDEPGQVAEVAKLFYADNINIANMSLYRNKRGGRAVMVIEIDDEITPELIEKLKSMRGILKVSYNNIKENK